MSKAASAAKHRTIADGWTVEAARSTLSDSVELFIYRDDPGPTGRTSFYRQPTGAIGVHVETNTLPPFPFLTMTLETWEMLCEVSAAHPFHLVPLGYCPPPMGHPTIAELVERIQLDTAELKANVEAAGKTLEQLERDADRKARKAGRKA
jgi:hypothetical protein